MKDLEITTVTGGSSGDSLKGCRFRERTGGGSYDFRDSSVSASVLVSSVTKGITFDLVLDGSNWKLNITSDAGTLDGTWRNLNPRRKEEEEEGTFQAQAGGHLAPDPSEAEEVRSATSASA